MVWDQILDGVEAAHLQKVVHRDLKPENVLYDPNADRLVVADFGIAQFEEEDLFTAVETKDGTRLANFQYAAPEQRERGRTVNLRVDIYALGLILNEMFTGQVPMGTNPKTIASVASQYAYLDALVDRMTRQDPAQRPESIEVIKNELIGRRNEFISQQRLSELQQTVITQSDVDDPLILDPLRVVAADYQKGDLILKFNHEVTEKWIWALQNMGSHSAVYGKGPEAFRFLGNTARVGPVREIDVQDVINHFKDWLPLANGRYRDTVHYERSSEEKQRRQRIAEQVEEEERRLRILNKIKI